MTMESKPGEAPRAASMMGKDKRPEFGGTERRILVPIVAAVPPAETKPVVAPRVVKKTQAAPQPQPEKKSVYPVKESATLSNLARTDSIKRLYKVMKEVGGHKGGISRLALKLRGVRIIQDLYTNGVVIEVQDGKSKSVGLYIKTKDGKLSHVPNMGEKKIAVLQKALSTAPNINEALRVMHYSHEQFDRIVRFGKIVDSKNQ